MNVLLVDLIIGGHSAPYASKLKRELETRNAISNVDFVTIEGDKRLDNYFTSTDEIQFIQQGVNAGYGSPISDSFNKMIDLIKQQDYTVVHILQVDNVLAESATILPYVSGLPPIVAHINGAFFGRNPPQRSPTVHELISKLMSSPFYPVVKTGINLNKSNAFVGETCLYKCINSGVFDNVLVHTKGAKEYLANLGAHSTLTTVVPEPPTADSPEYSQEYCRQQIGVGLQETVLLFFGGLRKEKGINRLLKSLQQYDGTEFTLVIAGQEKSVNEGDIQEIEDDIIPSVSTHIGYVENIEQYFIACDGVLCPYLEEFGDERTSGVFQEAIRLRRPVICPSFGSFNSRLNDYNLGMLYDPNTTQALTRAIHNFVDDPKKWHSTEDMIRFSETHSFENLCSRLLEIYQSVSQPH